MGNPYHDKAGRFSSRGGGGGPTPRQVRAVTSLGSNELVLLKGGTLSRAAQKDVKVALKFGRKGGALTRSEERLYRGNFARAQRANSKAIRAGRRRQG